MNSLDLLGTEEDRQTTAPGGEQRDGVLSDLIGQDGRCAGDGHIGSNHRGDQAVVHAGR